ISWPPCSPDLTSADFFLWGYIKNHVHRPPLPNDLRELWERITAEIVTVTPNMLECVWQETDYCWDVCRITGGSHIEL
ncbi:hypothetical protein L798_13374, partial [Zootermopsis nevadensis]